MTDRQREIVQAFADGMSRADVAGRFGVSHAEVDAALRAVLRESWTPAAPRYRDR